MSFLPYLSIPILRILLLFVVSLTCVSVAVAQQQGEDAEESIWARNLRLMFKRDEPRAFVRYPEEVYVYIEEGHGFYTQLAGTAIGQAASSSKTQRSNLLNFTYDFAGGWEALPNSKISWWIRGGRPLGDGRNANLSEDIGSKLDINASLENNALYLRELYWAQGMGSKIRYSLGWIDASYRYDFNVAANDDQSGFISLALVNSSSIPFPERSLGFDLLWQPNALIDAHIGWYQSNCKNDSSCIRELNGEEWFAPVEVIFMPVIKGLGQGHYRLLGYYTKTEGKEGKGFSLSLDQQIGRLTPFLRYSVGDSTITDFKRFASFGVNWEAPLGRPYDTMGLGFATGRTSDPALRQEKIFELFWRFRINPFVSLSPDVQFVLDPASNREKNHITVFSLRLQLDF